MANLYLIGFMGAGKTTIGQAAAHRLARPFIDLDEWIARDAGTDIPAIFSREGEQDFRLRERRALEAVADCRAVVATGGGILTYEGNHALMEQSGIIVCLNRPIEMILGELDVSGRPMAAGGKEKIAALFERRRPLYQRATAYQIANDGDPEQAVEAIAVLAGEVLEW
jgi:shikimate kinase